MEQVLWQLVWEQADYIEYLEGVIETLKADIGDITSLLDGIEAKLEASGL